MAKNQGLNEESFEVTTEDGYKLNVQHVWSNNMPKGAPVVFFQHGLFSSSDFWCMNKDKSAAYRVAHAGYDVWLGNNRGTHYSRGHVSLNAEKDFSKYFDYSFYELGKYDAPTQIDFVRNKTGHDKISYIGHSQGTS